jgi:hypothetical protein
MKQLIAGALMLCATAWGQNSNNHAASAPGRDTVGKKGNRIHHFYSLPAQAKFRADQEAKGIACGATPPGCTTTNLQYNGGPVMRNPVNYLIFWQPAGGYAPAFPAGYQAGIEKYFNSIGGTPYYNIVTQFNDSSGATVPNSASLGAPSYTDTTTAAPSGCDGTPTGKTGATPHCPLTDADIQNEVSVALAANPQWQQPGINVEYFVFTPNTVGECSGADSKDPSKQDCFDINQGVGSDQVAAFCAYHSYFSSNTIYAYIPFASDGNCVGSATAQYPNGAAVDLAVSPVSHEMIESNTDPLINAWKGTGSNSDEIGDKCAYIYGYVAPDGTNVVLNGNRFQIQEEFSNDVTACTKRYGLSPVTASPGPLAFGEVENGTSSTKTITVQNNGGGDLNILNIRLGTPSSYYSLLNGQPTAATLHVAQGMGANIKFAPPAGSFFSSPSDTLVVDTDETPCSLNSTCDTPSATVFANISGTVGVAPSALCKNPTVSTDPNLCSTANASVDNGSHDPDGESVTVTQSPAGPYSLGTTNVTLTVVDNGPDHASAFCPATVTVKDMQAPNISCPAPQTVKCTGPTGAAATVTPTFSDNCPAVTAACVPASGSTFGFGTTAVTCTATDASGNKNTCGTSVTVEDIPPTISSVVAFPNVLTPPNKKLDPVQISVKDTDPCDPAPVCAITSVTANVPITPADYTITGPLTVSLKANGNGGHTLTYVVSVTCTDAHGGSTVGQVSVSAPAH